MKYIEKLSVRILLSVLVGFLFAGAFTKISYTCAPIDGAAGCVSIEKAIMHPGDLLSNKQASLVQFATTFAASGLGAFATLFILIQMKPRHY